MSWSLVVPTNRPDRFATFISVWAPLLKQHDVSLHVVVDGPNIEPYVRAGNMYCWSHIPDFIPRKTDMIRSWGIYQAWKAGTTYTLSLDDDVLPEGDIFDEYERVFEAGAPCSEYLDVGALTSFQGQLRGFPFRDRERAEVAVQYGGWHGVLDYDAPTQLAGVRADETFHPVVLPVPRGAAVTGCIMNCAWRTEYAPIMWQFPLDAQGRFNRFGDIWSALVQKKYLDSHGKVMVINGKASVRHKRASDPLGNLAREAPGIPHNEELWGALGLYTGWPDRWDALMCILGNVEDYFRQRDPDYAAHFKYAKNNWLALFS